MVGEARITDSLVLSRGDLQNNVDKHCVEDLSIIKYRHVLASVLSDAKRYEQPRPYEHRQGQVIWVNLET